MLPSPLVLPALQVKAFVELAASLLSTTGRGAGVSAAAAAGGQAQQTAAVSSEIVRAMKDAGMVPALTAALQLVDLDHPQAIKSIHAILRPLEILTRAWPKRPAAAVAGAPAADAGGEGAAAGAGGAGAGAGAAGSDAAAGAAAGSSGGGTAPGGVPAVTPAGEAPEAGRQVRAADCRQLISCRAWSAILVVSGIPYSAYHILLCSPLTHAASPAPVSPRYCRPCGPRRQLWRTWTATEPELSAAQVSTVVAVPPCSALRCTRLTMRWPPPT
jgi:hypothetical protein